MKDKLDLGIPRKHVWLFNLMLRKDIMVSKSIEGGLEIRLK